MHASLLWSITASVAATALVAASLSGITSAAAPAASANASTPTPTTSTSAPLAVPLCSATEPGEKLTFSGRILDENGQPLSKASIIAYQTDTTGLYVPRGSTTRNPRLRAVAITDDQGRYSFTTIRPGPYPGTGDPEHIHLHVDAAVHAHTYVTFWFDDDPLVTDAKRRNLDRETVIVKRQRDAQGTWSFTHDIRLKGS
jgi:protocatechuate 3,4-dioxygenase beta subunit